MDKIENNKCCACSACYSICPTNAISMNIDEKGFKRPVIDKNKCINCGLCEKTCAFNNKILIKLNNQQVYAIKVKDEKKRKQSQSGGAFSIIAEKFLKKSSLVYGVTLKEDFNAEYIGIDSVKDLHKLKGSKYVQAQINDVYKDVLKNLQQNKIVFFSGTPCHIDGLLKYLKINNVSVDNLYTCDIVCHGTPSPQIFKNYIKFQEKEYKSQIQKFNFRDKLFGWHSHIETIKLKKRISIVSSENYVNIFYSHLCLRNECYNCPYASTNRVSDITIGDYWGIEKIHPNFDDNKGISLVILNNEKGKKIFQYIKNDILYIETSLKDCIQPNLQHPTKRPKEYYDFWNDYRNYDFEYIIKKYCNYNNKENHLINHYFLLKYKDILKIYMKEMINKLKNFKCFY